MYKLCLLLFSVLLAQNAFSQSKLTWNDFGDVDFKPEYNEIYEVHFLMPTFGEKITSYQGKEVQIKGYFLDISGTGEVFLISANPMASCFFCGGSGPESIIEVVFKEEPPFKTDQIVEVTGILELNKNNVDRCNYILKEASGQLIQ